MSYRRLKPIIALAMSSALAFSTAPNHAGALLALLLPSRPSGLRNPTAMRAAPNLSGLAMPRLHPGLRMLIQPRRDFFGGHAIEFVDDLVLALLDDPTEQLGDVHQRRSLVAELELDLAHLAGVFAAAVDIVVDRDLGQRRRLLARQAGEIENRVAARAPPSPAAP